MTPAELDRVTEFIRAGMRAGRISSESGELLITAAEREVPAAAATGPLPGQWPGPDQPPA